MARSCPFPSIEKLHRNLRFAMAEAPKEDKRAVPFAKTCQTAAFCVLLISGPKLLGFLTHKVVWEDVRATCARKYNSRFLGPQSLALGGADPQVPFPPRLCRREACMVASPRGHLQPHMPLLEAALCRMARLPSAEPGALTFLCCTYQ